MNFCRIFAIFGKSHKNPDPDKGKFWDSPSRSWFNLTISEWNSLFQISVNIVELAENFKLPQAVNVPFPLILLRKELYCNCTIW